MKHIPILLIAFSSIVVDAPAFAQCRNGWCRADCSKYGCYYVRVISRNWPIVMAEENGPVLNRIKLFDCQQYKWMTVGGTGQWFQMMPGSIGETVLETACGM